MDDDTFISLNGWGIGKLPIRGGMGKVQGGTLALIEGLARFLP